MKLSPSSKIAREAARISKEKGHYATSDDFDYQTTTGDWIEAILAYLDKDL